MGGKFTDLSGFSRGVEEFGIIHFLQTIYESQRLLIPCIDDHDGILLKVEADSLLVIFRRPEKAVECAVAMQRLLKKYNDSTPEVDDILLCIGLGFGRMLRIGDNDVFGAEVNAACKLGEDKARPWQILVTEDAKDAVAEQSLDFTEVDYQAAGKHNAFEFAYNLEA